MFDYRYHALSLAAVLFALTVGVLIGVAIGDSNLVSSAKNGIVHNLESEVNGAQRQAGQLQTRLNSEEAFTNGLYPLATHELLNGRSIGLVFLGGSSDQVDSLVRTAVAQAGGDIVAVIRSTAQSLLDYVPYGPTTEGYGGTFAAQANFKIMREALDAWSEQHGRYVRLSSFCSGLCMPEIAAMGAIEGLDNMVNDALYGILYRDINPIRGLIDQRISRMVNGYFGVTINTGEDNYLRTADAIEAAPSVTASQFINRQLALDSGVPDSRIALGDAFEIDPPVVNGLLFEWAQAQLTRELFPDCPVKYMPPTRHMDGNLYRTHATDSLFNLVTIATGQGIQTIGVPTEGIFTPHVHDRVIGLENVNYVFDAARAFIYDAMDRVEKDARTALTAIAEGDTLITQLAVLRRFSKHAPLDTIAIRRRVAEAVLAQDRYPFEGR